MMKAQEVIKNVIDNHMGNPVNHSLPMDWKEGLGQDLYDALPEIMWRMGIESLPPHDMEVWERIIMDLSVTRNINTDLKFMAPS